MIHECRRTLVKKGGKLRIVPALTSTTVTSLSGPEEDEKMMMGGDGSIACKAISLYPIDTMSKRRMGDPIADRFSDLESLFIINRYSVVQFKDRGLLFAVCDGAGWGAAPRYIIFPSS